MRIKDVKQIALAPKFILERKELGKYIEIPCLPACLYLYDKNIHTYSSGCNKVNYDNAHIQIEYDLLSEENKEVAENLIRNGYAHMSNYNGVNLLTISIPTTSKDRVDDVCEKLLSIVRNFCYQDVLYGFQTKDEFIKESLEGTLEFKFVNNELVPIFEFNSKEELEDRKREVLFTINEAWMDAIDENRIDLDNNIVWDNSELFYKHLDYLKNMKGKVR